MTLKLFPKNQKQLVIYYLHEYPKVSLKDVINDSMFIKFQARLSEIEQEHGYIAKRTRVEFTNRFKHKSYYFDYSLCIEPEKLLEIYNSYK